MSTTVCGVCCGTTPLQYGQQPCYERRWSQLQGEIWRAVGCEDYSTLHKQSDSVIPESVMLKSLKKQICSLCAHHEGMPFDDVTEEAAVHDGKSY